jgi:large subunit ribosomal protein L3
VFKNKKMAGHLGVETVTVQNLTVYRVDVARGLIMVKGAVPGAEGGYVKLRDAVKIALPADAPKPGAFKAPLKAHTAAETPAADDPAPASEGAE